MSEPRVPRPLLVLASASPARSATLRAAGIDVVVQPSHVDEEAEVSRAGLTDPGDVALLLARRKAESVASLPALSGRASPQSPPGRLSPQSPTSPTSPTNPTSPTSPTSPPIGSDHDESGRPLLVVGCDSVLDLDGKAFGKPADAEDARRRWRTMRGRGGVLRTGHWLIGRSAAVGAVASTVVHFADVTDDEIDAYVATGEPLGVAGAFTVDGIGGAFVTAVEGDHHNVVGISLPLLRRLLRDLGTNWTDLWRPDLRGGRADEREKA